MELAESVTSKQLLEPLVVLQPGLWLEPGGAKVCLSISFHVKEIAATSGLSLILKCACELEV
jgi:lipoate-protein ligase B